MNPQLLQHRVQSVARFLAQNIISSFELGYHVHCARLVTRRSLMVFLLFFVALEGAPHLAAEENIKEISSCEDLREELKPLCRAGKCIPRTV